MSAAMAQIVNNAITDGFCRWCRVLVGCEGHKATSECPVAIAEEELRGAQPTTPAPAWETRPDSYALVLPIGVLTVFRPRPSVRRWYASLPTFGTPTRLGPYPTAPEAARAAVAALRAIVVPVVEQLARVPDLEMP